MTKFFSLWRIVTLVLFFAIGAWAFVSTSGPAPETALRERAVFAAAYSDNTVERGEPSGNSFIVEPAVVNLADVQFVPVRSMHERWLAGEIDLDEMEARVGPAQQQALMKAAINMPPSIFPENAKVFDDPGVSVLAPQPNNLSLLTQFVALDVSSCCGGGTSVPPDSDLAAGTTHLVAVQNSSFAIYNKSGVLQAGPILFDNFLTSAGVTASDTFDPTVLYDEEENRFVMGIEDGANFFQIGRAHV